MSNDELEIAEASLAFALQNCPVEGLLSDEEGAPISLDELQGALDSIRRMEQQPEAGSELEAKLLSRLRSVMDYTSENCPVESIATFHDGRPINGRDVVSLAERLKG